MTARFEFKPQSSRISTEQTARWPVCAKFAPLTHDILYHHPAHLKPLAPRSGFPEHPARGSLAESYGAMEAHNPLEVDEYEFEPLRLKSMGQSLY